MRIRTGYSFRYAYGSLSAVSERLKAINWKYHPISDRSSCFAFNEWSKLVPHPIYGVELAVVKQKNEDKPILDWWTFFATKELKSIHSLVAQATISVSRFDPELSYSQAIAAKGVVKVAGESARLDCFKPAKDLYIALSPATSKGFYNKAKKLGHQFIATSDNYYPRSEDKETYRIALGWRSTTQTYPLWILSDEEWNEAVWVASAKDKQKALSNRDKVFSSCSAKLQKATLVVPERKMPLRDMCIAGAKKFKVNLKDPIYKERLDHELKLIHDKKFEDYFYIIADIVAWAKERMIVGPARGSSCGSLVCYLLGITAIDPIEFGLIFERFVDINRNDLPDIDIDFSDNLRKLVFDYIEQKYGDEHTARLGTVNVFRARSALSAAGKSLAIPAWKIEKVLDALIDRSSGDSRALFTLQDTLNDTGPGKDFLEEYPEALAVAPLEGHPTNASQHAAGVIITEKPIMTYVAVDKRTDSAMCNKKDAEDLGMLKIDMLGLTQLSVFERTLELIGVVRRDKRTNIARLKDSKGGQLGDYFKKLPLDDPAAFAILNSQKWSGIFQFNGSALQSIAKSIHTDDIEDIISMTALARPGPMASGGTNAWIRRKTGAEPVTYAHPIFKPYIEDTLGVMTFQEQIMQIGREVGGLSWDDVTQLRKAMSRSLGKEYFDRYGDRWKAGAISKGIATAVAEKYWDDMCQYGSWCLSGDTTLKNPHPNQHFKKKIFTLKELYDVKGIQTNTHGGKGNIPRRQKLLCLQGKTIKPATNVDVIYSGKRETWLVEVDSGEQIRATMEHRFLCSDMKYRSLKQLKTGNAVLMLGKTRDKGYKGIGRGGQNWWPKYKNCEPLFQRQLKKLRSIYKLCQNCKKRPYQETHHLDGDHDNNAWENLLPVCRKCHKTFHQVSIQYSIGKSPRAAHIVSISDPKIEDTYDVTMPIPYNNFVANDFIVHNSFNKAHAVAYGLVSYYCCWLKAHYPSEFAAATLDSETDSHRQILMLRELKEEGIDYIPVDINKSIDRWSRDEQGRLLGPLTMIKGIGSASVITILEARKTKKALRPGLITKLSNPRTPIDSIYPVTDTLKNMVGDVRKDISIADIDLTSINILSQPTLTRDVQLNGSDYSVLVIGVLTRLVPRDENETINIVKRGGLVRTGQTAYLNFWIRDDTDELFCKIDRFNFIPLDAKGFMDTSQVGKTIVAIRGIVPNYFRMVRVQRIKMIGKIDTDLISETAVSQPSMVFDG
jgi:DNA polymerase III alpha subunit